MIIGILDYGIGNVGSVKNMINHVATCEVRYISRPDELNYIDKLVIPGVGSYDTGVGLLRENGLFDGIKRFAEIDKKPVLGICLGMQLLGNRSEEGNSEGLGLIDFEVRRFSSEDKKVPHMGWTYVTQVAKESKLLHGLNNEELRFYFVHSYYAVCASEENVLLRATYGHDFVAAVCKNNIYGTQFHPEKSHSFGMKIIKNFVEIC